MFVLLVLGILVVMWCIHAAWVDAIKSPANRAGGNPNAPYAYRNSLAAETKKKDKRARRLREPTQLPIQTQRWTPQDQTPPPPPAPKVIYLTDSDPTPPYGIS